MKRNLGTIPENKFKFHGLGVGAISHSLGSLEKQIITKLCAVYKKCILNIKTNII